MLALAKRLLTNVYHQVIDIRSLLWWSNSFNRPIPEQERRASAIIKFKTLEVLADHFLTPTNGVLSNGDKLCSNLVCCMALPIVESF